jgi:hypothetical protein
MTIIQGLERKGVQKLELRIIVKCWENNISPSIIAKIMGFSTDEIESVIAYVIQKNKAMSTYEEGVLIGIRKVK